MIDKRKRRAFTALEIAVSARGYGSEEPHSRLQGTDGRPAASLEVDSRTDEAFSSRDRATGTIPRTDGGERGGTLVGIRAAESVVLAADTRTTRGGAIATGEGRKLAAVHPTAAIGSPDPLQGSRELIYELRSEVDRYEERHDRPMRLSALTTVAGRELRSRSLLTERYVLGGVDETASQLFTVDADEGVLETDYTAAGSGHQTAYGVLEEEYADSLSPAEARELASRALESAVERDPLSGAPVDVAECTEKEVNVRRYESPAAVRANGSNER